MTNPRNIPKINTFYGNRAALDRKVQSGARKTGPSSRRPTWA